MQVDKQVPAHIVLASVVSSMAEASVLLTLACPAGGKYVTFDAINFDSVPTMTVSFQNDSISIPQYEVSYTGPNSNATVSSLTYVGLEAAMLAPLDSCDAWIINKQSTHLWYDTVIWTGPAAQLPSWTPVTAGYQGWTSVCEITCVTLNPADLLLYTDNVMASLTM